MYLSGLDITLPARRMTTQQAIEAREYDVPNAERDGYFSAAIEDELYPADMGLLAAQKALAESGHAPEQVATLSYASIHRHGHARLWSPAAYLQHQLKVDHALPVSIQHGCNGGFLALKLMAPHIQADRVGLLVTADRFSESGFNRWLGDYGLIYGDAAVAATVSAQSGFAKILHFDICSLPALERLHRLPLPSPETTDSYLSEYDIRQTKKSFLEAFSREGFVQPIQQALTRLRHSLLNQYNLSERPARWLIPPFVGNSIREETYEAYFGDLATHNAWQFGREIGHTGASDGLLGLHLLRQSGQLQSKDRVLVISAGAGFSCSVVLLEMQ
ncbi:ketoacyl-ACP synthase III family protein [Photobacterium halotolerans]|uniref:Beta-ketoacyl-[acyl-carrier-protein] synthase III C-terminal domain-containing protein n=2 Tax=Photobacterium TaxID=657 RepID=A0A0F5VAD3_9GAMM|nr:ketoacyl-ACP synthase III family protein [Photobacterium halotolerans]KKC98479.1 hypothetical protein KY46_17985 [Photobacterium halotolerans]